MDTPSQSCPSCGKEVKPEALLCDACGAALPAREAKADTTPASQATPAANAAQIGGHVLSLIGSLMLAIGPFLPWATIGFLSASGLQKTGNEAMVLTVLGIIGVVVAVTSLITKRILLSLVPLLLGLAGFGLSLYYYLVLRADLFAASLGAGIYVCLIGGVLVFVSAILSRLRPRSA
jgi:hypothetical protein